MVKECTKCHEVLDLNSNNFHYHKASKDGFYPQCKICKNDYRRTPNGKQSTRVKDKNKLKNHPEKVAANKAVKYAVRIGKIPKANTLNCVCCNKQADEYHHWCYSKEHRLDVIPVCRICHSGIHNGLIPNPLSSKIPPLRNY